MCKQWILWSTPKTLGTRLLFYILPSLSSPSPSSPPSSPSQTGTADGFSTLRSHFMVSRQAAEWQLQSELKEQMQGYKRLRQTHKGQVRTCVYIIGLFHSAFSFTLRLVCVNGGMRETERG